MAICTKMGAVIMAVRISAFRGTKGRSGFQKGFRIGSACRVESRAAR